MVVFVCFGCFFVADGLILFTLPIWLSAGAWGIALTSVLGTLGCGLGALMIISARTGRIDLYPDAIVVSSALSFSDRRMERKDIAAKMVTFIYTKTYVLYPISKDQRKLTVGTIGNEDDYLREWMASIPDADKKFLRDRLFGRS
jgi:hypothetical protein